MSRYFVVGFMFNSAMTEVVMIKKNPRRPEMMWQKDLLNGVGGKVEESDENALAAMIREYHEEAGVAINNWTEVASLIFQENGGYFQIDVFAGWDELAFKESHTTTHEEIVKCEVENLSKEWSLIDNVVWLIPLSIVRLNNRSYPKYICQQETRYIDELNHER